MKNRVMRKSRLTVCTERGKVGYSKCGADGKIGTMKWKGVAWSNDINSGITCMKMVVKARGLDHYHSERGKTEKRPKIEPWSVTTLRGLKGRSQQKETEKNEVVSRRKTSRNCRCQRSLEQKFCKASPP